MEQLRQVMEESNRNAMRLAKVARLAENRLAAAKNEAVPTNITVKHMSLHFALKKINSTMLPSNRSFSNRYVYLFIYNNTHELISENINDGYLYQIDKNKKPMTFTKIENTDQYIKSSLYFNSIDINNKSMNDFFIKLINEYLNSDSKSKYNTFKLSLIYLYFFLFVFKDNNLTPQEIVEKIYNRIVNIIIEEVDRKNTILSDLITNYFLKSKNITIDPKKENIFIKFKNILKEQYPPTL